MEKTSVEGVRKSSFEELTGIKDAKHLERFRVKYLGRNGVLTAILRSLKDLPLAERRTLGPAANSLRNELEKRIKEKLSEFSSVSAGDFFDASRPGKKVKIGHPHPLAVVEREMREIFESLGFATVDGPEIETDYYNFDALNIPPDHPARDMWDTFWLKEPKNSKAKFLLRTHTSPMQVRFMESHQPPFQIIVPGRVFRYEATDVSHEINFYQLEGLMVGKGVSLANFKAVIEEFFKRFFNKPADFRYRPSYFPFVEPGLEVDIKLKTENKWLEVMGAGMVHPRVFEAAGYNPRELTGFAFGMGVDRLAMIKYKIPDIRLFYAGDLRLTTQFK
ncbi:MAG: phenylalanine--tRNA ligase subunit alpha [Parcubacteria group bacterium]|nr:phenylalanine--tRNA ligase subunit alpha [Parcubacteria group bacterium]